MFGFRAALRLLFPLAMLAALVPVPGIRADSNSQVINYLATHDTYVTTDRIAGRRLRPTALGRLNQVAAAVKARTVREKLAILGHYPYPHFAGVQAAAEGLLNALQFSGVLILASPGFATSGGRAPGGIGVASDQLTQGQAAAIGRAAGRRCATAGYVTCVTAAARLAAAQVRRDKNSSFGDAARFWFVMLVGFGLVILATILILGRRGRRDGTLLGDLRQAARPTLALVDTLVGEIGVRAGSLPPEARAAYDRALHRRDRARDEVERSRSVADLRQANEQAAGAVLDLQTAMRLADIPRPFSPASTGSEPRCVYCGRTDRPPYTERTIEDGQEHSLQVAICAIDLGTLRQGKTPRIAIAPYQGGAVPWWAIPDDPWYDAYGGGTWQYWLPYLVGLDVAGWMSGGWRGFDDDPTGPTPDSSGNGDVDPRPGVDAGAGSRTG